MTGIDFVQVVDPGDQRQLRVFFLVDPDALGVDPFDLLAALPAGFARIDAVADDSGVPIAALVLGPPARCAGGSAHRPRCRC